MLNTNIEDTQREIIEYIADTLEANFGSENHSKRMIKICKVLAGAAGPSKKEIKKLCLAVLIHEIGKIRVFDNLLLNAGGLNKEEMLKVRYQADIGFNLLKGSERPLIKVAVMITRDHNDYWDGNGYPKGKSGEEIHIFCRITNIANAFDTMRSKGNCKEAWPLKKVMEMMAAEKGHQFDPKIVEILQENIGEI
jgi:response regulator RpfG family c-di-GMP phosphodiesterase